MRIFGRESSVAKPIEHLGTPCVPPRRALAHLVALPPALAPASSPPGRQAADGMVRYIDMPSTRPLLMSSPP